MASAPTSRLRCLDLRGTPLAAPREWERTYIEVLVPPEQWQSVRLTRNGEPLEILVRELAGAPRIVAEWPRSGTGHYGLELEVDTDREDLRLAVWPRKL